jgi:transposase InsO family protein
MIYSRLDKAVLRRPLESAQYLSIRYTERLREAGGVVSVGSRGDSYDNALAESFIGLYKTELVTPRGPWRGDGDLGLATLEYLDWFNHRRLHTELGMLAPAEFERRHAPRHGPRGPVEADRLAERGGAPAGLGR